MTSSTSTTASRAGVTYRRDLQDRRGRPGQRHRLHKRSLSPTAPTARPSLLGPPSLLACRPPEAGRRITAAGRHYRVQMGLVGTVKDKVANDGLFTNKVLPLNAPSNGWDPRFRQFHPVDYPKFRGRPQVRQVRRSPFLLGASPPPFSGRRSSRSTSARLATRPRILERPPTPPR